MKETDAAKEVLNQLLTKWKELNRQRQKLIEAQSQEYERLTITVDEPERAAIEEKIERLEKDIQEVTRRDRIVGDEVHAALADADEP